MPFSSKKFLAEVDQQLNAPLHKQQNVRNLARWHPSIGENLVKFSILTYSKKFEKITHIPQLAWCRDPCYDILFRKYQPYRKFVTYLQSSFPNLSEEIKKESGIDFDKQLRHLHTKVIIPFEQEYLKSQGVRILRRDIPNSDEYLVYTPKIWYHIPLWSFLTCVYRSSSHPSCLEVSSPIEWFSWVQEIPDSSVGQIIYEAEFAFRELFPPPLPEVLLYHKVLSLLGNVRKVDLLVNPSRKFYPENLGILGLMNGLSNSHLIPEEYKEILK